MSFFAHFEIWCKFRFVFSKNKKLMFLDTFEAHICGTFIRRKYKKTSKSLIFSYMQSGIENLPKMSKITFFKTNRFFPSQWSWESKHFVRSHFWTILEPCKFFTLKRHFSDIWKIMQIPARIGREHNLELRSVCGSHFTPTIAFWAELMLLNEFHKRNFRENFFSELFREVFVEGSSFWPKSGLLGWL